jgi:fused signal recognition particle receptor
MGFFRNIVDKFKQGLQKTREAVVTGVQGLRNILTGRTLDEELINEIERRLLQADVGVKTTAKLIDGLRADFRSGKMESGDQALEYLKREIAALWPAQDRSLRFAPAGERPSVILMTGVNGVGKTTSIAKLCAQLRKDNKTVLLGACDTFRAGAVAQLETWANRLGVEVVKGQQGGDPAAVAFDACSAAKSRNVDVLILDTAGRLQTQDPLMRQLTKIRSVIQKQIPGAPHEVLLVLDATSGQNALRQAEEFSKAAGVTGIFLAKLDGTAKGGIVIAVREVTDIPVKFVGVGETPDDVQAFEPGAFVEALFAGGE